MNLPIGNRAIKNDLTMAKMNPSKTVAFKTIQEERNRIITALKMTHGQKRVAAKMLKMHIDKLYDKLETMNIPSHRDHYRPRATPEELRHAKISRGFRSLGRKYGVNRDTIKKWFNDLSNTSKNTI